MSESFVITFFIVGLIIGFIAGVVIMAALDD